MQSFRTIVNMLLRPLRWMIASLLWLGSLPGTAVWWLRQFRVEPWLIEGEERSSGLPLSVVCTVAGQDKNHAVGLLFGPSHRETRLGRCWLWNLSNVACKKAPDASFILADLCESHLKFSRSNHWFLLPMWLLGETDLPRDAAANRKVSENLRKIRKHAFQFDITQDPKQFDHFYHQMYVPHITETFGDRALVSSYQHLKKKFAAGDLLMIKQQDRAIAGILILYPTTEPFLYEIGILDGNRSYVRDGAGSACYHFSFQHLQEQGYRKVFLGWSRSFLHDGVLQFKRSWSQKIVDGYSNGYALRIVSPTPAALAVLRNNPFIFRRHGVFCAAVFVDTEKPLTADELQKIDKDYFHAGLSRLFVFCSKPEHATMPDTIATDIAEHIELRGLDDWLANPQSNRN